MTFLINSNNVHLSGGELPYFKQSSKQSIPRNDWKKTCLRMCRQTILPDMCISTIF